MSDKKVDIVYEEASLDGIINYYCKGFKIPKGQKLLRYEHFLDTRKGRVIIRLFVESNKK